VKPIEADVLFVLDTGAPDNTGASGGVVSGASTPPVTTKPLKFDPL
jgi:hypothetical protein